MTTVTDERSNAHLGTPRQREGRIFLTAEALEFYDMDYTNAYKNFVIPLNELQIVDAVDNERNNEIKVRSTLGKYEFIVPDNSANKWKSQIIAAWERNKTVSSRGRFSSFNTK